MAALPHNLGGLLHRYRYHRRGAQPTARNASPNRALDRYSG